MYFSPWSWLGVRTQCLMGPQESQAKSLTKTNHSLFAGSITAWPRPVRLLVMSVSQDSRSPVMPCDADMKNRIWQTNEKGSRSRFVRCLLWIAQNQPREQQVYALQPQIKQKGANIIMVNATMFVTLKSHGPCLRLRLELMNSGFQQPGSTVLMQCVP